MLFFFPTSAKNNHIQINWRFLRCEQSKQTHILMATLWTHTYLLSLITAGLQSLQCWGHLVVFGPMHLPLYIRHAHDFIARNTNNGDHVKSCSNLSQNNSWTCYFQQNTQNSTVTFSIIFCCIFFSYSVFPAPSVSLHILYHKPEIKKSTDWQLPPPPVLWINKA